MMFDAFANKTLADLESEVNNAPPAEDGFDQAWFQGMAEIIMVFQEWDGGISENFLAGIKRGIEIYESNLRDC